MQEQEDLVSPGEAAKLFYVTPTMIYYWANKGRIKKHYVDAPAGRWKLYKVSISEIDSIRGFWRDHVVQGYPDLITRKEAASLLNVSLSVITYYTRVGHLRKHYVLGNNLHYLVEREQVLAQPDRIAKMYRDPERLENLRRHALNQPKVGKFFAKRTD